MPLSKTHHKKKKGYWLNKWLNKALIVLKFKKRRFQKPPTDIVFLTTKEVKESLSKVTEREPENFSLESTSRPDLSILPAKNRSRRKSGNDKSLAFRLKRLLTKISFGILKKKRSLSSNHQRSRSRVHEHSITTDTKFQKINELKRIKENAALKENSSNQDQRHHHHRKHFHRNRFRRWKSFLLRKLHISRKKSGFSLPVIIENAVNTTANQEKKDPWTNYIQPALTSTAMFMVAYQLSWLFYQLAVMVTASFFKFDSVLYYYEVMFPEGSDSVKWSPEKIIIITLAGPFLALVTWIILRLVLKIKERYGSHFRMFLVWIYLISMMMFFGAFVGGAITLEGFGYVIDWLFMSISLRLILSLIFIGMIIALSWNVAGFMPETSRSSSWKNNRYKYILSRLIIPWFIGTGIMTLLKITKNVTQHENIFDYDIINLATLAFAVVPPLFNSVTRPQLNRRRKVNQKLRETLPVIWITVAILVVMLFRIVLSYGIYFKLVFNLDMSFYK